MTDTVALQGGCLCGAVRYTATAMPFARDYCHCRMCQRCTGAPVSAWMDFKVEQLQWHNDDQLREYASTADIRRGFCTQCGATLTFRSVSHPQYLTLAITSLDHPEQFQPTYHIYTESQLPWLNIDDDCKRYPQGQT
ncbi:MAG: GFA family protein [Pseudomonadota bacterium]